MIIVAKKEIEHQPPSQYQPSAKTSLKDDLAKQNHAPTYQSKSYQQRLLAHPHLEMHTAEGQCHDIAMQLTGLIWTGFLSILLLSDDDVAKPVVGDKSFRL